jgi:hypothetical protein
MMFNAFGVKICRRIPQLSEQGPATITRERQPVNVSRVVVVPDSFTMGWFCLGHAARVTQESTAGQVLHESALAGQQSHPHVGAALAMA